MKAIVAFACCTLLLYANACTSAPPPSWSVPTNYPFIEKRPAPASWDHDRGKLASIPTYDPKSQDSFQVDLRGYDLSDLDLSGSADLGYADFDSRTIWPPAEHMLPGFEWQRSQELGMNPGLRIRQLHQMGITGRGVGIAIVDQPLLVEHQEYAAQLGLYTEINLQDNLEASMHGPAVASLAVGKTVGVAPDADLYYVAAWPMDFKGGDPSQRSSYTINLRYYAEAIERIIAVNGSLPDDRKIRVISISMGWRQGQLGYEDAVQAVEQAKAAGILVVNGNLADTPGFRFGPLGRQPLSDPDVFESYEPGMFWADHFYAQPFSSNSILMIPMDSRTTASPGGVDEYAFYRIGGLSWSIPWVAGLYALAAQVDPNITPERFWALAMQTGHTIQLQHDGKDYQFGTITDPVALVDVLTRKR